MLGELITEQCTDHDKYMPHLCPLAIWMTITRNILHLRDISVHSVKRNIVNCQWNAKFAVRFIVSSLTSNPVMLLFSLLRIDAGICPAFGSFLPSAVAYRRLRGTSDNG